MLRDRTGQCLDIVGHDVVTTLRNCSRPCKLLKEQCRSWRCAKYDVGMQSGPLDEAHYVILDRWRNCHLASDGNHLAYFGDARYGFEIEECRANSVGVEHLELFVSFRITNDDPHDETVELCLR